MCNINLNARVGHHLGEAAPWLAADGDAAADKDGQAAAAKDGQGNGART